MKNKNFSNGKSIRVWHFFIAILIIAMVYLISPASVHAGRFLRINSVMSGQVINEDVFLSDDQPSIEGRVNGDVFMVGSDATISGEVNGSVFVLAEKLNLNGKINGNLFVLALDVNLSSEGQIERSLYGLTLSLITEPESSIGRNMNIVAISARLNGKTDGDTIAIIGPWELFKIFRDVFNENIIGFNNNQQHQEMKRVVTNRVNAGMPFLASIRLDEVQEPSPVVDWLIASAKSFLSFLIVGALVLWIFPRQLKGWTQRLHNEPLASAGYGILVLINGYLIPTIGIIFTIGILLGLIFLSLPSLAWMLFWIWLGLLITLIAVFQLVVTYISKVILANLLGTFILSKIAPISQKYPILPLMLGLLIYVLLASIPYLGFIIGLVATLFGLGAIWLGRKNFFRPPQESNEVK